MSSTPDTSPVEPPPVASHDDESQLAQLQHWLRERAPWWASSFTVHLLGLSALLLLGRVMIAKPVGDAPTFFEADRSPPPVAELDPPDSKIQIDPPPDMDLTSATIIPQGVPDAPESSVPAVPPPGDSPFSRNPDAGASPGDFSPRLPGPGPVDKHPGSPGSGTPGTGSPGLGPRDPFTRPKFIRGGPTRPTDNAVKAGLFWLAHHQSRDGSWRFREFQQQCKDRSCTGLGSQESVSAATALGLLPFLGAGQTHLGPAIYRENVAHALYWLLNHQKADGDLSADAPQQMYSHGLATIALCEAYGMTKDKTIGVAAQRAINFIQAAQNAKTGGWRYHPGEEGDTSVGGWQLMALKSAQIAGLTVSPAAFDGFRRWLNSVSPGAPAGASSAGSGHFTYQPGGAVTPSMTAVGVLSSQYLHAGKADPVVVGGVQYLMANLPDENARNIYYWYYASQALHNMDDKDWDTWNRKMREILVREQVRTPGCAFGSWDPEKPVRDAWAPNGGRVMMTSFATLTLEVYYRYLPLYRTGGADVP